MAQAIICGSIYVSRNSMSSVGSIRINKYIPILLLLFFLTFVNYGNSSPRKISITPSHESIDEVVDDDEDDGLETTTAYPKGETSVNQTPVRNPKVGESRSSFNSQNGLGNIISNVGNVVKNIGNVGSKILGLPTITPKLNVINNFNLFQSAQFKSYFQDMNRGLIKAISTIDSNTNSETLRKLEFTEDTRLVFIISGGRNQGRQSREIKDNYIKYARNSDGKIKNLVVLVMDWSHLNFDLGYIDPRDESVVRNTAWSIRDLILNLMRVFRFFSEKKVDCVGSSYGAHVCAIASQILSNRLNLILGLDPRAKRWGQKTQLKTITVDDATTVKIVHTDMKLFGSRHTEDSQIDIFVDGGFDQEACKRQSNYLYPEGSMCSHRHATDLLRFNIGKCMYVAYRCESSEVFKRGLCGYCDRHNKQCISFGPDDLNQKHSSPKPTMTSTPSIKTTQRITNAPRTTRTPRTTNTPRTTRTTTRTTTTTTMRTTLTADPTIPSSTYTPEPKTWPSLTLDPTSVFEPTTSEPTSTDPPPVLLTTTTGIDDPDNFREIDADDPYSIMIEKNVTKLGTKRYMSPSFRSAIAKLEDRYNDLKGGYHMTSLDRQAYCAHQYQLIIHLKEEIKIKSLEYILKSGNITITDEHTAMINDRFSSFKTLRAYSDGDEPDIDIVKMGNSEQLITDLVVISRKDAESIMPVVVKSIYFTKHKLDLCLVKGIYINYMSSIDYETRVKYSTHAKFDCNKVSGQLIVDCANGCLGSKVKDYSTSTEEDDYYTDHDAIFDHRVTDY